jgi:hypothetical protein
MAVLLTFEFERSGRRPTGAARRQWPLGQSRKGSVVMQHGLESDYLLSAYKMRNRPQRPLGDRGPADRVGHGQDVLLDFGGQAQQAHDLGDASPGDALAAGDLGLVANLAGFEEGLPLKGLAEKLDDTWRSRRLGRLAVPVPGRNRTDDVFGGHAPRQDANVVVFEGPLRAQCDLDGLFVVGGHMGAVGTVNGDVDDAKPDFRLGPARAATSRTVTFGEPNLFRARRPARSLTPLSACNSATGRVFGTSPSLLCPP